MVFIVAEIGVNWDGDFDLVKQMMEKSKKSGCDAVKFQAYSKKMVENHPESERLLKSTISKENIEEINDISKSVGIEWFGTPMYEESVELLDPYVKRFKIREFDGRPLLENKTSKIMNKILETNKEIIISSQKSPKNSIYFFEERIKWLYCEPKYPCALTELDFSNMNDFFGYSNHTANLLAPICAIANGAKLIEIHITSDKSKKFIDNNISFDYKELENLVPMIRLIEQIKFTK